MSDPRTSIHLDPGPAAGLRGGARGARGARENGVWSQYLQVGLGTRPEVFTKGPLLTSVGHGRDIGVSAVSTWNNPEPELALVIDRKPEVGQRSATDGSSIVGPAIAPI